MENRSTMAESVPYGKMVSDGFSGSSARAEGKAVLGAGGGKPIVGEDGTQGGSPNTTAAAQAAAGTVKP